MAFKHVACQRLAISSIMLAISYDNGGHGHSSRSSPTGPARHRLHGVEADGTLRLWRASCRLQRRSLLDEGWQAPFLLLLLGLQHLFKCIFWRVRGQIYHCFCMLLRSLRIVECLSPFQAGCRDQRYAMC